MTSVEELPVPLRLEWSGCPKVAQRPLSLKTEAGMESNPSSEVASLEPCTTPAGAVKLHKKLELNPKESQARTLGGLPFPSPMHESEK